MILTLLTTDNPDNAAESTFTSGIDSTYDEYMFVITALRTGNQGVDLKISFSGDGGSNYTYPQTTTIFSAYHQEDDGAATLSYEAGHDQAQGTGYQRIMMEPGNGSDESGAGILHLFSPADTTYVTHFYGRFHTLHYQDVAKSSFVAGYINVTAAITAINFKMSSGNFDGVIQMYGIA